jgi:general secretion pathway protein G
MSGKTLNAPGSTSNTPSYRRGKPMKKVLKKRTGFTLVELLIVIIIISILAGSMLLVAGSATDKAEATKIVSDLRGLKAAALMYYADKTSSGATVPIPKIGSGDLNQYIDRQIDTEKFEMFAGTGENSRWYIGRKALTANSGVNTKLEEAAVSSGLFKTINGTSTLEDTAFTKGAKTVYMRVR